jgi:DNA-binding response OmpR family regulator
MADADERRSSESQRKGAEPPTSSSDRVRLEVSILSSASDDGAPEAEDEASGTRPDLRTVLVVAAESDMRIYVRRCLRRHGGIHVVETADRVSAVRAGTLTPPDIIILDADGPQPAAKALVGALRSEGAFASVPLLIISDEEEHDAELRHGSSVTRSAILVKPFNSSQLCAEVERMLGMAQPSHGSGGQGASSK